MNLLLTGCFPYTDEQINNLKRLGYNVYFLQQESELLLFPIEEIDAVVCNGLFLYHDINNFTGLQFIQLTSAGLDRVPVDIIKARGIQLYNARGVYSTPMAEWAIFRVLEHYKQGQYFKDEQINCRWTKHRGLREIAGITVAVIGAGNVGQEVAKHFKAFDAKITGFDIHTNKTAWFDHMELTAMLEQRIDDFDVVIVTAPLLPTTKGLISREVLHAMKQDAVIVNIARGGLIDENALVDVLTERKDLFAALDVFEQEPLPAESPLWKMRNVAVSPHNSFVSDGNNVRMYNMIYDNLKKFRTGQ